MKAAILAAFLVVLAASAAAKEPIESIYSDLSGESCILVALDEEIGSSRICVTARIAPAANANQAAREAADAAPKTPCLPSP